MEEGRSLGEYLLHTPPPCLVLRYASRARAIKNKLSLNKMTVEEELEYLRSRMQELETENAEIRAENQALREAMGDGGAFSTTHGLTNGGGADSDANTPSATSRPSAGAFFSTGKKKSDFSLPNTPVKGT